MNANVVLCDKNFNSICMLNNYKSLIWNTRFCDIGDFEIYLPVQDNDILEKAKLFAYVYVNNKYNVRIITSVKIEFNSNDGYMMIISGHSLSYLLKNRIIWNQTNFQNTNVNDVIIDIVKNNSVVSYCSAGRELFSNYIENYYSSDDITAQYYGESLYDTIKGLCEQHMLGFDVIRMYSYTDNKDILSFELNGMINRTKGTNLLYYQPIVFDTRLNNILTFSIDFNGESFKNVELITGEGDGVSKLRKTVNNSTYTKLDRCELYVNAQDLSQNSGTQQAITQSEYEAMLEQRGLKNLESYKISKNLECTIDTNYYKYKSDYNVGDIVTVVTPFLSQNLLIKEVTENWNENGYSVELTLDPNYQNQGGNLNG